MILQTLTHIPLTLCNTPGYIAKYGPFNLGDIMFRRDLRTQELLQFLHWFADPLVGRETWRANQATTDVSDILTVCDEAYIYLTIESNYEKWLYLHQRTVSTTQTTARHTKPLITHMDVHNSRNKRWPTGHTAATTQIVQRQNTQTERTSTQAP